MENNPKAGDYIRVDGLTEHNVSLMGYYVDTDEDGFYLVDFNLADSDPKNGYTVLVQVEPSKATVITEEEYFLWRLKGRGIGLMDQ